MALRSENQNIVAAKIIGMTSKRVMVVTEDGHLMSIPLTKNNQQDNLMIESPKDIWRAQIWIPVNKKLKHFFRFDWLTDPATEPIVADDK